MLVCSYAHKPETEAWQDWGWGEVKKEEAEEKGEGERGDGEIDMQREKRTRFI